jgi:hypothetical protein
MGVMIDVGLCLLEAKIGVEVGVMTEVLTEVMTTKAGVLPGGGFYG